jgi:hypothetical protein
MSNRLFFDRQEGGLGGKGVITGDVTGSHLECWFEHVLKEARKDSFIQHMFVQSHLPVLNPVRRKVLSQAMFLIQVKEAIFGKLWSSIVHI